MIKSRLDWVQKHLNTTLQSRQNWPGTKNPNAISCQVKNDQTFQSQLQKSRLEWRIKMY